MSAVSSESLIAAAAAVLNPRRIASNGGNGRQIGHVAAALVTATGQVHRGVCIDTGSGTGFCAEHSAIAAMVTAGETTISQIVAVHRDGDGRLHVVPPCGRCREFMRQIDPENLDTEVILGSSASERLRDLLPHHEWHNPSIVGLPGADLAGYPVRRAL